MKALATASAGLLLAGCAGLPPELQDVLGSVPGATAPLSEPEIAAGLKEALATGTQRAVGRIGVRDGFWLKPELRIPLPDSLKKLEKSLRALGQGEAVEEFHLSLNRAAEAAVPEATTIFAGAIRNMTLADARQILGGPPDAATAYFRDKTLSALTTRFQPVVAQATNSVGATRRYKELVAKVAKYAPNYQPQDLDAYVTNRALAGVFRTLAEEEGRIRADPAARSTELLRRVFGAR